jgi:hypothetical protein
MTRIDNQLAAMAALKEKQPRPRFDVPSLTPTAAMALRANAREFRYPARISG